MINRLPLLYVLAGSTLLAGCFMAPANETTNATGVQPSVQTAQKPAVPAAKIAAKPKPVSHPAKTSKTQPRPPAIIAKKPSAKPVAQKKAAVKTIKPDSPSAMKVGQKLTPEEVEDLIRKLSVCRPS